jgi:dGTPase
VYESDREAFEWVMKPFTEKEKDFFTRTESRSGHHRRTLNKTLECSVIEMADDIAYGTHDVEDAINLGLIGLNELKELVRPFGGREEYPELRRAWKELDGLRSEDGMIKYPLKKIFAALISVFITRLEVIGPVKGIASPRLQATVVLPDDLRRLLDGLKLLVLKKVIESQRVQTIAFKGTHIVKQLFSALMSEKKLLPENDRTLLEAAADERERARVVCDYIAGMTDSFAMKMYHRLFGHSRSFFDF